VKTNVNRPPFVGVMVIRPGMNRARREARQTVPSPLADVQRRALSLAKPLHSTGQKYMPRRALLSCNLEAKTWVTQNPKVRTN
jgi:hypothetical protein